MRESLEWVDPLTFAEHYSSHETLVFLHSSLPHPQHGTHSILAVGVEEEITHLPTLREHLTTINSSDWNERYFGFMGYELDRPASDTPQATIPLPDLWFAKFKTVFVFDHEKQVLTRYGESSSIASIQQPAISRQQPAVNQIDSNMNKAEYLHCVEQTLEQIAAGEFYQANITRKFYGTFEVAPDSFVLFKRLCEVSPGTYSAYVKVNGVAVLSSSPECFLTIDEAGRIESRPIKGTAAHHTDPQELAQSVKDRAENLMIVDLMRNDLSQHCEAGSVNTEKLFEVTTYATLHHMDSTITGRRAANNPSLDLIQGCFPPGSMTGAPKKAVIQWCQKMEQQQRGIYSGALGWLTADGSADLSVVIRTLLLKNNQFEFQVGGGIVADSQPEAEWRETLTKAKGILKCLNIAVDKLKSL